MSILKITSGYSSTKMISYCSKEKIDRLSGEKIERCTAWKNNLGLAHPEHVAMAWDVAREGFGKCSGRQYHHASLSLDPKDPQAQKITDPEMIRMAEKFVQEYAPGHDYSIFIHRDKEHPHAHILWNSVHSETGLKFHASKKDLMRGMEIKDTLDREYGLEITKRQRSMDRIPDEIQRIHQRDPNAYLWTEDLKYRIDKARKEATSFSSLQEILSKNGVESDPRGRDGKISYRFTDENGKQRQCREGKLGEEYERAAIERDFQRNREQHQSNTREYRHTKDLSRSDERTANIPRKNSNSSERSEGIKSDSRARPSKSDRDHEGVAAANREAFEGSGSINKAARRLRELGTELIKSDRASASQEDDSRRELGKHYSLQYESSREGHGVKHHDAEKTYDLLLDTSLGGRINGGDIWMVGQQLAQSTHNGGAEYTGNISSREANNPKEKEIKYSIFEWRNGLYTSSERGIDPRTIGISVED
jgi:hypothetical protein